MEEDARDMDRGRGGAVVSTTGSGKWGEDGPTTTGFRMGHATTAAAGMVSAILVEVDGGNTTSKRALKRTVHLRAVQLGKAVCQGPGRAATPGLSHQSDPKTTSCRGPTGPLSDSSCLALQRKIGWRWIDAESRVMDSKNLNRTMEVDGGGAGWFWAGGVDTGDCWAGFPLACNLQAGPFRSPLAPSKKT